MRMDHAMSLVVLGLALVSPASGFSSLGLTRREMRGRRGRNTLQSSVDDQQAEVWDIDEKLLVLESEAAPSSADLEDLPDTDLDSMLEAAIRSSSTMPREDPTPRPSSFPEAGRPAPEDMQWDSSGASSVRERPRRDAGRDWEGSDLHSQHFRPASPPQVSRTVPEAEASSALSSSSHFWDDPVDERWNFAWNNQQGIDSWETEVDEFGDRDFSLRLEEDYDDNRRYVNDLHEASAYSRSSGLDEWEWGRDDDVWGGRDYGRRDMDGARATRAGGGGRGGAFARSPPRSSRSRVGGSMGFLRQQAGALADLGKRFIEAGMSDGDDFSSYDSDYDSDYRPRQRQSNSMFGYEQEEEEDLIFGTGLYDGIDRSDMDMGYEYERFDMVPAHAHAHAPSSSLSARRMRGDELNRQLGAPPLHLQFPAALFLISLLFFAIQPSDSW